MRREAASIRIQKNVRAHRARAFYTNLQTSAIVIQTGLRAMAARNEFRYRRRTKAATIVQVMNSLAGILHRNLNHGKSKNSVIRIGLESKQFIIYEELEIKKR